MKSIKTIVVAAACLASVWSASGVSVLRERALNVDGTVTDDPFGAALPALVGVFDGVIDSGTGLGTFTLSVTGTGAHDVLAFLDHDIDKAINTSFNELAVTSVGVPLAGQSWELGDPYAGTMGNPYPGPGIYDHFLAGSLANASSLSGLGVSGGDDVSMAFGWSFVLAAGETATVGWTVSDTAPGGFYLVQTDPDSRESIYFSSSLSIASASVPDAGSTLALLGAGLAALQAFRMRQQKKA